MSPTERSSHLRFSFPKGGPSYVVLDGYTGLSQVKIIAAERKITGYVSNNKNNRGNLLKSYFEIVFDKPFKSYGTWENRKNTIREHPFGTIKRSWGYTYTLLKGIEKVNGEMAIIFTMYNIRRAMYIIGVKELIDR